MYTEQQQEAIQWNKGPLLVLGTPGSGKTTVIINRINNLIYGHNILPSNILVITFTRAAAESMKRRFLEMTDLPDTKVRFGTFHSFFYWIVRTAYSGRQINVLDESSKRDVIRNILLAINKDLYDNEEVVTGTINQLSAIASDMIDIDNYYSPGMSQNDFINVYKKYNAYKKKNNLLDFDDMLTQCYQLLSTRKDILSRIREMYPYIMVDEFQDTNLLQYEILKLLSYPSGNIYVVGDDDQSIYGFRGARPDVLMSFAKEFSDVRILHLSNNFRCPEDIVKLSSEMIAYNKGRYEKELKSATGKKGQYQILSVSDIREENEYISKSIKDAIKRGVAPSEIAVLYRTNLEPRRLIYKLMEMNIDFSVRDRLPDIFSHPAVVPILNYIYFALGDHSRSLFLTFMNKPLRYISRDMLGSSVVNLDELIRKSEEKPYLEKNIRRLKSEIRTIGSLSPYAAVNYIREAVGYNTYLKKKAEESGTDYGEYTDILDEFQMIMKDIKDFSNISDVIEEYRNMLEHKNSSQNAVNENQIQLMTLHSAKGLEFKEVHILNVIEDVIPHKRSKLPHEIEEERRMLYVGMTRSSDRLYMYVPRIINDKPGEISRFLKEVSYDTRRSQKENRYSRF